MTSDDSPLADLSFSLVGPGRVGASLAHWACARGARLLQVAGRNTRNTPAWVESLGARATDLLSLHTDGLDFLLLALPDAAYEGVVERLATRPQPAVVLHTSGSEDASLLDPLRSAGAETGSLHPLKAFPEPLLDLAHARGVFFAVDGTPEAVRIAERLVAAWEARSAIIAAPQRLLYHSAATLAAGGVATLMAVVWDLAQRLELPEEAWAGYLHLARGALEALEGPETPAQSITGPAARGDEALIERELAAIGKVDPELEALARLLWQTTRKQRQLHPGSRARFEEDEDG